MLVKVLLLLLPAIVYGRISVRVRVGKDEDLAEVEYFGSIVEIIPDKERETWQINDERLKDAAEFFSGARPTDVFVKSPTPWDDLYTRYEWPQVQRTLYPLHSRILGITTNPVVLTTQEIFNNGTDKATYNTGLTQTVTDTISSTWSKEEGELEIGEDINYSIEFGDSEIEDSSSISYKSLWGEETMKSEPATIGSSSGVSVDLEPGQSVIATLSALQGTMEVQIFYKAELSGRVACNYEEQFNEHYFYGYYIDDCLQAAALPTSITSSETIKIGFYVDPKVTVSDVDPKVTVSDK